MGHVFVNLLRSIMAPPSAPVAKQNEPLAAMQALASSGNVNNERGQDWARTVYGDYYATTVPVYRSVQLRANAVARARMKAWVRLPDDSLEWVGEKHPVQHFLDKVNPFWSRSNLWRGVENQDRRFRRLEIRRSAQE